MKKNLRALRQQAAELRAEGARLSAELAELEAKKDPTDEEKTKLATLRTSMADWEKRAEEAAVALEAAEDDARRQSLMDGLNIRPGARLGSNEPDPARTGGFRNIADFANAVRRASDPSGARVVDDRLQAMLAGPGAAAGGRQAAPTNFHKETASADGWMVPKQFNDEIYELMIADDAAIINMVDSEPTASNQVQLLRDETTPWGASGVQANWRAEGSQMTPSRLATEPSDVKLHELYAFVLATEELLEDAPRLNARLTRQAARAINWKANEAIMFGDGVGKPLGWMSAGCLVSVAKESGQAADTINVTNIGKMYSRMLAASLPRSVWMINSDCLPALIGLQIGDQPAWMPPMTGINGAPGGTLLGRPVIPNDHCKTLGDLGDIQFVDPLGYYLARKASGVTFAESMHLYFDYNMRAFRWTFRLGGQPYLSAAVSPAKGSNTKSHFVALAERA